jgi:hypothetical protein
LISGTVLVIIGIWLVTRYGIAIRKL